MKSLEIVNVLIKCSEFITNDTIGISKETVYQIKQALEKLEKLEKAFEILREKLDIDVTDDTALPEFNENYTLWVGIEPATISKEEYELLEELMRD